MNGKLKAALIVGVALLVGGVAVGTVGYAAGGMKDVAFTLRDGPLVVDRTNSGQMEKVDEVFEDVSSIEVHVSSMSRVVVKEGPTLSVKGQSPVFAGGLKAERAADGALTVTQGREQDNVWWFSLNFLNLFTGYNDVASSFVEITVPRAASPAAVTLDVDFGEVRIESLSAGAVAVDASYGDVAMENVAAGAVSVKSDSGAVTAKNLTCDSLKIFSSYGDVSVADIDARDASVESNSGDIEVANLSAPDGLTVESSYGNVDFATVSAGSSNVSIASGDFSANDVSFANGLNVDSSYGDIEISGVLRGDSIIESDSGDVELRLDGAEDDYRLSADVDSGKIVLGDRKVESFDGGHFETGSASAANSITIDSSYGDVEVGFRG